MQGMNISDPIWELVARFVINTLGVAVLIFGMYYRRYRDKVMATTASMFNISAFAVLTILSSVEFSIAAGFGLFAILALFSLRSEQIDKIEIAYFFGAVAIAVICSVQGTALGFVLVVTALLLVGAWVLDHPNFLQSASDAKITLDRIDRAALADRGSMQRRLSEQLGVEVMSYQIIELNYVNELARLRVFYRG